MEKTFFLAKIGFGLLLLSLASSAQADMDIPVNKVTSYSGADGKKKCEFDPNGGGVAGITAGGDFARDHTVDGKQKDGYAVAAVPRAKSKSAGIFKCFFRDQQNYPGIKFRASDTYGKGSNGLEKYDASHECTPLVKSDNKPATTIVVEGSCGGVRGGADTPVQRPNKVRRNTASKSSASSHKASSGGGKRSYSSSKRSYSAPKRSTSSSKRTYRSSIRKGK